MSAPEAKKKKAATGGAAFSPRLDPRPQYPSWGAILRKYATVYTRLPILLALSAKATFPIYTKIVKALKAKGWSDPKIFALLAFASHTGPYVLCNSFYGLCDYFELLPQYKLTAKASQRPSANLIKRTLQEAFVGQFLMTPLAGYFGYHAFMIGGLPLDAKLPGLFELCKKFALGTFVSEHVIYLAHRTLHHKALYARFHKQHHSYVESMGISAEFAGPVEQLFVNFVPTLCGGALRGSHPFIFFFWLIYRLTETYETHSGYYFGDTFLGKLGLLHGESSSFHHAHHLENRGNFASWHVDALFGTMDAWLADGDYDGYLEKHLHGYPKKNE